MIRARPALLALAVLALFAFTPVRPSGQDARFTEALFEGLAWRNLGPFRTGE